MICRQATKNWYIILPFLFIRLVATFFSQVPDCDEVFNYWEPLHFLLYGHGLQTWEYSPTFALRTYAYPLMHAIPAVLSEYLFSLHSHIAVFYAVRTCLALACGLAEIYFVCAVKKRYGNRIGFMTSIFLLCSPGMFLSSPTFLPSTFTMLALTVSMAAWFDKSYGVALAAATVGTFLSCWPYVAVSFVPVGLDALARKNVLAVVVWCLLLIAIVNLPILAFDAHFYGFLSYTPWNIVRYNVVEAKANLYGVESWTYYPLNLILNFNVCFLLSCVSFVVPVWQYCSARLGGNSIRSAQAIELMVHLMPLYIWAVVMQTRPHKEERFIYFVYTMICFSGAVSLDWLVENCTWMLCGGGGNSNSSSGKKKKNDDVDGGTDPVSKTPNHLVCYWSLTLLALLVFILVSCSRIINVIKNFRAPMEIYSHLHDVELPRSWGSLARFHHHDGAHDGDHHTLPALQYTKDYYNKDVDQGDHVAVCVGKEWYRYPSSFYLRPWSRLYFLQSGFTGQLPSKYIEHGDVYGTMAHTPHMNDNNEEEISRYIDYKECHYIIDLGRKDRLCCCVVVLLCCCVVVLVALWLCWMYVLNIPWQ